MKQSNPEKITNEKFLNLYKTKCNHDGKEFEWIFASRREGATDPPDAVVIVPILNKQKIILVREYRVPLGDYEWGFPAGLRAKGEDIVECAKRELEEETGYLVDEVIAVSPPLYSSAGLSDESVSLVYVHCVEGGTRNTEATEEIEVVPLDKAAIPYAVYRKDLKFSAKAWPILHAFIAKEIF